MAQRDAEKVVVDDAKMTKKTDRSCQVRPRDEIDEMVLLLLRLLLVICLLHVIIYCSNY